MRFKITAAALLMGIMISACGQSTSPVAATTTPTTTPPASTPVCTYALSLGNTIDPVEMAGRYGTDALRYYLLRAIRSTDDGDFTLDRFIRVYVKGFINGTLAEKNAETPIPALTLIRSVPYGRRGEIERLSTILKRGTLLRWFDPI